MRIKERDPVTGEIKEDFVDLPIEVTLDVAKQRKYDDIKANAATYLATFKSSALGSEYTYLSGLEDMLLLSGEYAFVKGTDFDNNPIMWYTIENGNISHSGAEFIQIYLDARANVQIVKYHQAIKNAQTDACASIDQVDTIGWINPNPPNVPTGLVGSTGATGSGQVALSWAANTDVTMLGGGGYKIYVDGSTTKVNATLVVGTTYTATGLTVGTHTFAITAVDTDGLESAQCSVVSVTVS